MISWQKVRYKLDEFTAYLENLNIAVKALDDISNVDFYDEPQKAENIADEALKILKPESTIVSKNFTLSSYNITYKDDCNI